MQIEWTKEKAKFIKDILAKVTFPVGHSEDMIVAEGLMSDCDKVLSEKKPEDKKE